MPDVRRLREMILRNYAALGAGLGWRLLYGPERTLCEADVAYVSINPGGDFEPSDQGEFTVEGGSAYVIESWKGQPAGTDSRQRHACELFRRLGVKPEEVLAGVLIPYRSPAVAMLPDLDGARRLGKEIWSAILDSAKPRLIVCDGDEPWRVLRRLKRCSESRRVAIGWGNVTAEYTEFDGGRLVRIPHTSRYKFISRPQSRSAVEQIFAGHLFE